MDKVRFVTAGKHPVSDLTCLDLRLVISLLLLLPLFILFHQELVGLQQCKQKGIKTGLYTFVLGVY